MRLLNKPQKLPQRRKLDIFTGLKRHHAVTVPARPQLIVELNFLAFFKYYLVNNKPLQRENGQKIAKKFSLNNFIILKSLKPVNQTVRPQVCQNQEV